MYHYFSFSENFTRFILSFTSYYLLDIFYYIRNKRYFHYYIIGLIKYNALTYVDYDSLY